MKKIACILFLFIQLKLSAQIFYRRSEFGVGAGGSNYYGDLNPGLDVKGALYSGSLFYKYNFTPYIAMKLGTTYAKLSGNDNYSTNIYQQARNLNFKSDLIEASFAFDFHFFKYKVQDYDHRITPYVTIGLGIFWHNPYTMYKGKKYNLRPLGTEGQLYNEYANRRYKAYAFDFPIGAGFKVWVTKGITLNVEVINRSTTTDYIDDVSTTYVGLDKFVDTSPSPYPQVSSVLQDRSTEVSDIRLGVKGKQRGVSTTKDQFMTAQIGISVRLPTYKCPSNFD
jgi:Domain of unknown function (DUF6089)